MTTRSFTARQVQPLSLSLSLILILQHDYTISNIIIRLHQGEDYCFCHYYYSYYYSFFFRNEVYRTNTKPAQVWTPSGLKNTDPLSATLTYFSTTV